MAFVETQARHTDRLEVRLNEPPQRRRHRFSSKHLGFEALYEVDLPSGPFQRNDGDAKLLSADPKKVPLSLLNRYPVTNRFTAHPGDDDAINQEPATVNDTPILQGHQPGGKGR
ncbi:MAG: hypothetical protein R2857_04645 [Vampirovibrionales bacterium]